MTAPKNPETPKPESIVIAPDFAKPEEKRDEPLPASVAADDEQTNRERALAEAQKKKLEQLIAETRKPKPNLKPTKDTSATTQELQRYADSEIQKAKLESDAVLKAIQAEEEIVANALENIIDFPGSGTEVDPADYQRQIDELGFQEAELTKNQKIKVNGALAKASGIEAELIKAHGKNTDPGLIAILLQPIKKRLVALAIFFAGKNLSRERKIKLLKSAGFSKEEIIAKVGDFAEADTEEQIDQPDSELVEQVEDNGQTPELTPKTQSPGEIVSSLKKRREQIREQVRSRKPEPFSPQEGNITKQAISSAEAYLGEYPELHEGFKSWKAKIEEANEQIFDHLALAGSYDPASFVEIGGGFIPGQDPEQTEQMSSEQAIKTKIAETYKQFFPNDEIDTIVDTYLNEVPNTEDTANESPVYRRIGFEMRAMAELLIAKDRKNKEYARIYYAAAMQAMNSEDTATRLLQKNDEGIYENDLFAVLGQEPVLSDEAQEFAEQRLKDFILADLITDNQALAEASRLFGANFELHIGGSGPIIITDKETIQRLASLTSSGQIDEARAAELGIDGLTIKGTVIATRDTLPHEMLHLENAAIRYQEKQAKQLRIQTIISKELDKLDVSINNRSQAIQLITESYFESGLDAESINAKLGEEGFQDEQLANYVKSLVAKETRAGKLLNYYKEISRPPLSEELAATMLSSASGVKIRPINAAQIGINPEKIGQEGISEQEMVIITLINAYNEAAAKALNDDKFRTEVFKPNLEIFTYLLSRKKDMTFTQLQRFLGEGPLASLTAELFPNLFAQEQTKQENGKYSIANIQAIILNRLTSNPDFASLTEEQKQELIAIETELLIGDQSNYLDINGISFNKGSMYSGLQKKFMTNRKYNPAAVKGSRGEVGLWYSFFGNRATIAEDTRPFGYFTPFASSMKMNEAFGAYVVRGFQKVAGKKWGSRIAGTFGFHDAFGADPIGKGLGGQLSTLWPFSVIREKYIKKIDAVDKTYMERLTSARIADTVAQHSASIIGELGKESSQVVLILESIGGFKQEAQGYENSLRDFREPDEHRFNRVFSKSMNLPPSDLRENWLANDSIMGRDMDDLITEGHELFLRKGQMSDNLKELIVALVPDVGSDPTRVESMKKKIYGTEYDLKEQFEKIANAMMTADLAEFNKAKVGTAVPLGTVIRHYTIEDLINAVDQAEADLDDPDKITDWPHVRVKIGESTELYEIDLIKEFVKYFYSAKAAKVIEFGVYGQKAVKAEKALATSVFTVPVGFKDNSSTNNQETKSIAGMYPESFSLMETQEYDYSKTPPTTIGTPIDNKAALKMTDQDIESLQARGYVLIKHPDDPTRILRIEFSDKQRRHLSMVNFVEYDQDVKIMKQTPQGFITPLAPVDAATEDRNNFLFGHMEYDTATGKPLTTFAKKRSKDLIGKVPIAIRDDIDNKNRGLGIYFEYLQKLMQTTELAEVTRKRAKFWAFITKVNKVIRWGVYSGVALGLTVYPPLLSLSLLSPNVFISVVLWDWFMSKYLDRSRDGWKGRNGIAEETAQKLEGMRNTFEQCRNGQTLPTDTLNMLAAYTKNIEKMWEDVMEKFEKLYKYKPNMTQEVSSAVFDYSRAFMKMNTDM